MVKVYYDADRNLDLLKGKTVAIIGFGSQGHMRRTCMTAGSMSSSDCVRDPRAARRQRKPD